jgi:hypothetical protein
MLLLHQHLLLRQRHPSVVDTFPRLYVRLVVPPQVEDGASVRQAEADERRPPPDQRGQSPLLPVAATRLHRVVGVASATTGKHPPHQVADTFPQLVVDKQTVLPLVTESRSLRRPQREVQVMENTDPVHSGAARLGSSVVAV